VMLPSLLPEPGMFYYLAISGHCSPLIDRRFSTNSFSKPLQFLVDPNLVVELVCVSVTRYVDPYQSRGA